jgi:hypothetical protein
MENKKYTLLVIVVLLIVLNFSVQNFNFYKMEMAPCTFFYWIPSCVKFYAFATNKIVRLAINFLSIVFILKLYKWNNLHLKKILFSIFLFYLADMALCYTNFLLFVNWHKVLNPILYSPLLVIVYSAYMFNITLNSKK